MRMVSDLDIFRSASVLVKRHGQDARHECVHMVEINFQLTEPFRNAIVEIWRAKCTRNEFYLDGNFVGAIAGQAGGVGIIISGEFSVGMLMPGKAHTLLITASNNRFCGFSDLTVQGLRIVAEPIGSR